MKHCLLDEAHSEYNKARDELAVGYAKGEFVEVAYHISLATSLVLESFLVQNYFPVPTVKSVSNMFTCAKVCGYSEITHLESMISLLDSWYDRTAVNISHVTIDKAFDIFALSYNYVTDYIV